MFPFRVQNAEDNHAVVFNPIKNFVWKSPRQQTAEASIINWPPFGVGFQQLSRGANFRQQFVTQTGALRFIPRPRFPQIRFSVWPNENAPFHLREDLRILASTSSQEEPAAGFS